MSLFSNPLLRSAFFMGASLMFLSQSAVGADVQRSFTDQARVAATQVEMASLTTYLSADLAMDQAPASDDLAAYLEARNPDSPKNDALMTDAWGSPYELEVEPRVVTLRSAGPDGFAGTPDDLVFTAG